MYHSALSCACHVDMRHATYAMVCCVLTHLSASTSNSMFRLCIIFLKAMGTDICIIRHIYMQLYDQHHSCTCTRIACLHTQQQQQQQPALTQEIIHCYNLSKYELLDGAGFLTSTITGYATNVQHITSHLDSHHHTSHAHTSHAHTSHAHTSHHTSQHGALSVRSLRNDST